MTDADSKLVNGLQLNALLTLRDGQTLTKKLLTNSLTKTF